MIIPSREFYQHFFWVSGYYRSGFHVWQMYGWNHKKDWTSFRKHAFRDVFPTRKKDRRLILSNGLIQWIGRQAGRRRAFEGGLAVARTSTHLEASLILSSMRSTLFGFGFSSCLFMVLLVLHTFPDSSRAEPSKGEALESRMISVVLSSLCLGWRKSGQ